MQRPVPPDANHAWRYDSAKNEWFYLVNGKQRFYHTATPRFTPNVGPTEQQLRTINAPHGSNYHHIAPEGGGSLPMPIPTGFPSQSRSFQHVVPTGFSPNSQSPGAAFQRQYSSGGPSVTGASPPVNPPPTNPGRTGRYVPPANTQHTGPAPQVGRYVPPTGQAPQCGRYVPPTDQVPQGGAYVPPANTLRTGPAPQGGRYVPLSNLPPTDGGRSGGEPSRSGGSRGRSGRGRGSRRGNYQPPANPRPDLSQVSEEQQQILDEEYKVRKRPTKFFRLGKVFLMVHTESFGSQPEAKKAQSTVNTQNNDVFAVAFGEFAFSKVRRFIVVSEQAESCLALAITTHSGKGAAKRNASEHGIVYTGAQVPPTLSNEGAMLTTAIRIDPFQGSGFLHPASRVNYAKTYNIEHNVRVKPYGTVHVQFMHHLVRQWTQVIIGRNYNLAQNAFRAPSLVTLHALGFTQDMIKAVLAMMKRPIGPSADARTSITSVARSSARDHLKPELEDDASERERLVNRVTAERLADQVVELIMAGMTYTQATDHVRVLSENGNGFIGENAAVDDDDEVDEPEEEADEDASSSDDDDDGEGGGQ